MYRGGIVKCTLYIKGGGILAHRLYRVGGIMRGGGGYISSKFAPPYLIVLFPKSGDN